MAPLFVAAAREFSERSNGAQISVRSEGSLAGIADVVTGAADAAFADLAFDLPMDAFMTYPVAAFPIAFIAHPAAHITTLRTGQIIDVLSGRIRNWSQLGSIDMPIVLINRDHTSGVRSIVERDLLSQHPIIESDRHAISNRAAALTVQNVPGAFSYVSLPAAVGLDVVPSSRRPPSEQRNGAAGKLPAVGLRANRGSGRYALTRACDD